MFIGDFMETHTRSNPDLNLNVYFRKVFLWMFFGLMITFGTALALSTVALPVFAYFLMIPYVFIVLILIQLALVFAISFFSKKISSQIALLMFLIYSFISGITFAAIFLVFALESIVFVFGLTAMLFAGLALFGYTTQMDLSGLGVILFITLIGIIIASLINILLNNPMFDLIISVVAVILFMGLIAFDMQKLKKFAENARTEEELNQLAVFGALNLYLDFVNLFINLLKLLGRRN